MSLCQPLRWGGATIVISLIGLGAAATPLPKWMARFNLRAQQAQQMQAIDDRYRQKVPQVALNAAQEQVEKFLVAGAPTAKLQQQFDLVMSLQQMLQRPRFAAALEIPQDRTPAQGQPLAAMNCQRCVNLPDHQGATMP
ncbi:MAG: hypothetical protein KatS3mg067_2207 [Thermosynechococcus sp.]|uniref:hypothetical protein n=1 Tax=Thermosynechococcus sp. TaxID=2814275 RepID=UPI002206753D|nr:hypothetical protein [Thermosynechococcus sp.]BCX13269.1 MAG: hypothetical protein KatS3mg067_2207 [Thermosynechococcus sp.]